MLVNAECAQMVCRRLNSFDTAVHPNVPQLHFAAPAATDELSLSATLEMHVCNPLFVFFPNLHHGSCGLLARIVHADSSITKSCDKDVTLDLVRRQ